jgi:DNA-binding transcriptional LysR family regulator
MELWQLRTFSVVAKTLHFTRAAEELNLSQPAVSHQIKSLENEIGEALFIREKDGICLTKAGQTMYEHSKKILNIADEMRNEINDAKEVLEGKIILSVASRGMGNTFPLLYRKFKEKYPLIDIFFQSEYKIDDIIEKVSEGKQDIGLISHSPDLKGLRSMPYGKYEVILAVGKNHKFAQKKHTSIKDLQNQDWIMFEKGNVFRNTVEELLSKNNISPKSIYETNDGAIMKSMLLQGNEITFLPEWGTFEELKEGKIIALDVKELAYNIQIDIVWKESLRNKLMTAVITFLLEEKFLGISPFEEK